MSLTYPGLMLIGGGLVLVPIIIHLLNKRKFKIIDWAAMDFLFEADKKNRRRVRLEDLIILLLRVLAVLLLVALVARPFVSGTMASALGGKVNYERIILLDDSPSMEARQQGPSALEQSRRMLSQLIRQLASQRSSDTLTIITTSRPRVPVISQAVLTPEVADRLISDVSSWPVSSRPAHYEDALAELEKLVSGKSPNLNRIVYVISDLRKEDWKGSDAKRSPSGLLAPLTQMAPKTTGCYLVNVGGPETANVAITALVPQEKVLAAGQTCRFEITVRNFGPSDVKDLAVRLWSEGSTPVDGRLEVVPAGKSATLPVSLTFPKLETGEAPPPIPLHAALQISSGSSEDRLAADNKRYYPARVVRGIPTLIVDGDATTDPRRSESFFLRRALSPPGDIVSGILSRTVTPSEFEALDLDAYQVVYLANLEHLSDARRVSLEKWVERGGGLVIALGDQLGDLGWFNAQLFRGGKGLAPAEVQGVSGDESRKKWAQMEILAKGHPVVGIYEGENNPFLEGIKVFRWWQCIVPESEVKQGHTRLLARLNDTDNSPLVIERTFGQGHVMMLNTPVDADWSSWPQDHHSYVLFMQFLTHHMAQSTAGAGLIEVGQQIKVPLDAVRHKIEAMLVRPGGERIGLHPVQAEPEGDRPQQAPSPSQRATDDAAWVVMTSETDVPGIYRVDLTLQDGTAQPLLFAANLAVEESDLAPADVEAFKQHLQGSLVRMLRGDEVLAVTGVDTKNEWWLVALGCLGVVLGAEQSLAWWFGRRR